MFCREGVSLCCPVPALKPSFHFGLLKSWHYRCEPELTNECKYSFALWISKRTSVPITMLSWNCIFIEHYMGLVLHRVHLRQLVKWPSHHFAISMLMELPVFWGLSSDSSHHYLPWDQNLKNSGKFCASQLATPNCIMSLSANKVLWK